LYEHGMSLEGQTRFWITFSISEPETL
jgi:hypothetical protein